MRHKGIEMDKKQKEFREGKESVRKMMEEEAEVRRKALYRRVMPKKKGILDMLEVMTKDELDDIRYNLGVKGASKLRKAELAKRLAVEAVRFAQHWFPSINEEEYECFRHLLDHGGQTAEFRDDDERLDYLRALGLVSCGNQDGKLIWYMPKEICEEFRKLDSGTFRSLAELNTETARLAAGCLFFYGYMDYDTLYEKVMSYLDDAQREQISFMDFVGILLNASCWQTTLTATPYGAMYYTLIDPDQLEKERARRDNLDFAPLTYGEVYDAGEADYIRDTPAYKELARFFMEEYSCDVLEAADLVGEVLILLQNDNDIQEAADFLEELGFMKGKRRCEAAVSLLIAFYHTTRLWSLKGHTPEELFAADSSASGRVIPFDQVRRQKVGRNDPCPCGSGKKYKNCCLRREEQ